MHRYRMECEANNMHLMSGGSFENLAGEIPVISLSAHQSRNFYMTRPLPVHYIIENIQKIIKFMFPGKQLLF